MLAPLRDWLVSQGLGDQAVTLLMLATKIAAVLAIATVADLVTKRVVVRVLENFVGRTSTTWDDIIVRRRILRRLAHLAPALVIYLAAPQVLAGYDVSIVVVQRMALIYMLLITVLAIDGVLSAGTEIVRSLSLSRTLPVNTVVQVLKLVLYLIAAIGVISLIIGQSPGLLLSGLGAMTAVLMLIFRDPILGLVAGVQLSANRMVAQGTGLKCRSAAPMAMCLKWG